MNKGVQFASVVAAALGGPALEHVRSGSHLPQSLPNYYPLRLAMCSQTCPPPPGPSHYGGGHRDGHFLRDGARYGPSSAARLLTCADAHTFAGRSRTAIRERAPFLARSSRLACAAHRDVRLAARGARSEERGRDARAIGWACRGTCFFHLGALISRDHMRLWA